MNKIYFGNTGECTPSDILDSREVRVNSLQKLIKEFNTTSLCMRVNYPGVKKNNEITLGIMKILSEKITNSLEGCIVYAEFSITFEGPMLTLLVKEDHNKVKCAAVKIEEEHPLGRCVDIDVYDKNNSSISRRDMGLAPRKCYICNEEAQICVRSRKHNLIDIENYIRDKYESYIGDKYSKI